MHECTEGWEGMYDMYGDDPLPMIWGVEGGGAIESVH